MKNTSSKNTIPVIRMAAIKSELSPEHPNPPFYVTFMPFIECDKEWFKLKCVYNDDLALWVPKLDDAEMYYATSLTPDIKSADDFVKLFQLPKNGMYVVAVSKNNTADVSTHSNLKVAIVPVSSSGNVDLGDDMECIDVPENGQTISNVHGYDATIYWDLHDVAENVILPVMRDIPKQYVDRMLHRDLYSKTNLANGKKVRRKLLSFRQARINSKFGVKENNVK